MTKSCYLAIPVGGMALLIPILALAETADHYDVEALNAYANNDFKGAVSASNKALAFDPRDGNAYNIRALGEQGLGNPREALEDFTRAITLKPADAKFYANRAVARHAAGDLSGAIDDDSQAIRLQPKDADYYDARGNVEKDASDLDGAIRDCDQAISLDPSSSGFYTDRGVVRQLQGQLAAATDDYDQAIRLNPNSALAYQNRGGVKALTDDTEGAVSDLNRAVALDPKSEMAYENLGVAYLGKEDYDEAIEALSHALALSPEEASAYAARGRAWTFKGDYKAALGDLDCALRLKPDAPNVLTHRAAARFGSRDFAGARTDAEAALRVNPRYAAAYRVLGDAQLASGDLLDAVANYDRSITLNLDEEDHSRFSRWLARVQLRQKPEADKELAASLARRPRAPAPDADARLGGFLLGRIDEAGFLSATAAARSSAEQARAWYYVGLKRRLSGDERAAREAFKQSVTTRQPVIPESTFALQELGLETPAAAASATTTPGSDPYQLNASTLAGIRKSFSASPILPGPADRNRGPLIDPSVPIKSGAAGEPDQAPEPGAPTPDLLLARVHAIMQSRVLGQADPASNPGQTWLNSAERWTEKAKGYYGVFWLTLVVVGVAAGAVRLIYDWVSEDWKEQQRRSIAIVSLVLGVASQAAYPLILAPAAVVCGVLAALKGNRVGWVGTALGVLGLVPSLIHVFRH